MKFDTPATTNPIDQGKVVGRAHDRIEGPLKTTGTAPYAYERHDVAQGQVYGYPVCATIAKGRIRAIDTDAAKAAPGVLGIVTAANAGKLGKGKMNTAHLLGGPEIQHYHQAVALVVAETFEQARAAAHLIKVDYTRSDGAFDLAKAKDAAKMPSDSPDNKDTAHGDFAGAFASAPVKLDATYTTPGHSHAMMEPHASIARWEGERLTLWTSNQMIAWSVGDVALTLGIPKENVRLVSPYIGGGFGGKLFVRSDALLAALGARAVGRPVKVTLPRPLIINNTTHRPATLQRIRLGATRDGTITAFGHESWSGDLEGGQPETAVSQSQLLYAGENRMTAMRLAVLDLPEGNAMRAPGEASGMMALEVAMDELAEKLGMDPVELRIRNDTQVDPNHPERPFSQRHMVECLRTGAEKFGWSKRSAKPGTRREGRWLIGMGMATAFRNNLNMKSGARVRLGADGAVTVQTDMTDIGTGSYTIIAQTAAETMGVPLDQVQVTLGDSRHPASAGSGGQWGAASSTAGVYAACVSLRRKVGEKLGFDGDTADFANGRIQADGRTITLAEAGALSAEDGIAFGDFKQGYDVGTYAGHFCEVAVHAYTGETRIRRMLAVCDGGRILNPLSARSQVIGGMVMGAGATLMEELVVDKRLGLFINHDLAGYEVPVHADIPYQEVVFLDTLDPVISPMKAKGVGELGICGVGAAIANAIYNATGVRVRSYPITLDKLLPGLPDIG